MSGDLQRAIEDRIAYGKKYRQDETYSGSLTSGWSSCEGGPCCDNCRMSADESNPLRALAGCRNPFQVPSVCQCHIPYRRVAEAAIQRELKNLLRFASPTNQVPTQGAQ